MKTVYFIRHGESEGNAGPIRQGPHTSLTKKGEEQAEFAAERCTKLPIDVVISSTMKRAKHTAEIIVGKIHKPIEFIERRRPSIQTGALKNDPEILKIDKTVIENFPKEGYRYSDEENFDDLKVRAQKALGFLESRSEENILVLSHGLFMRIVIAYAIFGDHLTGIECQNFIRAFDTENTGLSVLNYDDTRDDPKWHIWIWNDHAHLG